MSRKKKDKKASALATAVLDGLSARGKKVITIGAALVILGFIALSQADPMGRNAASLLSAFLIVGGYAAIGVGICLPDASPAAAPPADPQKTIKA